MIVPVFVFIELFLCFSAAAGVIFALVCFLDWLCGLLKVHLQNQGKKAR